MIKENVKQLRVIIDFSRISTETGTDFVIEETLSAEVVDGNNFIWMG